MIKERNFRGKEDATVQEVGDTFKQIGIIKVNKKTHPPLQVCYWFINARRFGLANHDDES